MVMPRIFRSALSQPHNRILVVARSGPNSHCFSSLACHFSPSRESNNNDSTPRRTFCSPSLACQCCHSPNKHHHLSSPLVTPQGQYRRHETRMASSLGGNTANMIGTGDHRRLFSSKSPDADASSSSSTTSAEAGGHGDLGLPGAQKGGKKLAIVFTCTVCDTRSAKQFTEQSYRHGVVIVQCPGCQNKHLIADNLGFFDDGNKNKNWNIETAMAELGENVTVVNDDNVFELSIDQVYGSDAVQKAMDTSSSGEDDNAKIDDTTR